MSNKKVQRLIFNVCSIKRESLLYLFQVGIPLVCGMWSHIPGQLQTWSKNEPERYGNTMIMKLCESTGLFRTLWCDNDSYFFLKEKEELEMRKKHEEEMKRKQEEFLKQQQEELRQQQLEIQREKEEMERKREALERETAIQLQVWVHMIDLNRIFFVIDNNWFWWLINLGFVWTS